jgi:hypothetical protein
MLTEDTKIIQKCRFEKLAFLLGKTYKGEFSKNSQKFKYEDTEECPPELESLERISKNIGVIYNGHKNTEMLVCWLDGNIECSARFVFPKTMFTFQAQNLFEKYFFSIEKDDRNNFSIVFKSTMTLLPLAKIELTAVVPKKYSHFQ